MFLVQYDLEQTLNETDVEKLLSDSYPLKNIQKRAISEVKSYIQHRYDPDEVFLDVNIFSIAATYAANAMIFYTESAYVAATTYAVDDRVSYEIEVGGETVSYIFVCIQESTGNLPTNTNYFTQVVENNLFYYAAQESTGNYPENTTYFTQGDLRDQSIVDITSIITIYYLLRKIQPRNLPEWIVTEYDNRKDDLKAYQKGTRMIELTVRTDADGEEEGHRITYGSETQKDWNY